MNREQAKVVFMGTPDFAVESLRALYNADYNIKGVVTVPDKPAGRGLQLKESPVKKFATEKGLKVLQPVKLKDQEFLEELRNLQPDIIVVVAFRMLPREVWAMPTLGTFNLHGSLLPRYRGAAPIQWAVMNGDPETGVTTFLLDEKIDTGKILLREKVPIGENENAGIIHDRLMALGAELVVKTCDLLISGKAEPMDQALIKDVEEKPAPKLFREHAQINWNQPVNVVYNQIRGLSPYPGAFTRLNSDGDEKGELKIFSSRIHAGSESIEPGKITLNEENHLLIAASDGFIEPLEVQLSGKKRMKMEELLRGFRLNFDNSFAH